MYASSSVTPHSLCACPGDAAPTNELEQGLWVRGVPSGGGRRTRACAHGRVQDREKAPEGDVQALAGGVVVVVLVRGGGGFG